jgi:hypothetical protein
LSLTTMEVDPDLAALRDTPRCEALMHLQAY